MAEPSTKADAAPAAASDGVVGEKAAVGEEGKTLANPAVAADSGTPIPAVAADSGIDKVVPSSSSDAAASESVEAETAASADSTIPAKVADELMEKAAEVSSDIADRTVVEASAAGSAKQAPPAVAAAAVDKSTGSADAAEVTPSGVASPADAAGTDVAAPSKAAGDTIVTKETESAAPTVATQEEVARASPESVAGPDTSEPDVAQFASPGCSPPDASPVLNQDAADAPPDASPVSETLAQGAEVASGDVAEGAVFGPALDPQDSAASSSRAPLEAPPAILPIGALDDNNVIDHRSAVHRVGNDDPVHVRREILSSPVDDADVIVDEEDVDLVSNDGASADGDAEIVKASPSFVENPDTIGDDIVDNEAVAASSPQSPAKEAQEDSKEDEKDSKSAQETKQNEKESKEDESKEDVNKEESKEDDEKDAKHNSKDVQNADEAPARKSEADAAPDVDDCGPAPRVAARPTATWSTLRSASCWTFPPELPSSHLPVGSVHLRVFDGHVQVLDLPITDSCIVFGATLRNAHVADGTHESVKAQHACLEFQAPDRFLVRPINGEVNVNPVILIPEVLAALRSEQRPLPRGGSDPLLCAIGDAPVKLDRQRCCFSLGRSHVIFFLDILAAGASTHAASTGSGAVTADLASSSSDEKRERKTSREGRDESPIAAPRPKRKAAQNALQSADLPSSARPKASPERRRSVSGPAFKPGPGTVLGKRMRGWSRKRSRSRSRSQSEHQRSPSPRGSKDEARRNMSPRGKSPKEKTRPTRRKSRSTYRLQARPCTPRRSQGRRSRSGRRRRPPSREARRSSRSQRRRRSKSNRRRSKSRHRSAKPRRRSRSNRNRRSKSRRRSKSHRPAPRRSKTPVKATRERRRSRSRKQKSPVKRRAPSLKPPPKKKVVAPLSPATSLETDLSESSSTSPLIARKPTPAPQKAVPRRRAASSSSPEPASRPAPKAHQSKKVEKKSTKTKVSDLGKRRQSPSPSKEEVEEILKRRRVAAKKQADVVVKKPSESAAKRQPDKQTSKPLEKRVDKQPAKHRSDDKKPNRKAAGSGGNLDDIDVGFGHGVVAAATKKGSAETVVVDVFSHVPKQPAGKVETLDDKDSEATDLEGIDAPTPCPPPAAVAKAPARPPPPHLPGALAAAPVEAAATAKKKGTKEKKEKKVKKIKKRRKVQPVATPAAPSAPVVAARAKSSAPVGEMLPRTAATAAKTAASAATAVEPEVGNQETGSDTREALANRLLATQKELLRLQMETKARQLSAMRTELQKKQALRAKQQQQQQLSPAQPTPVMLPAHLLPLAAAAMSAAASEAPAHPKLSPAGKQRPMLPPGRTKFTKGAKVWVAASRAAAATAAKANPLRSTLRNVVERHQEKVRAQREQLEEAQRRRRMSGTPETTPKKAERLSADAAGSPSSALSPAASAQAPAAEEFSGSSDVEIVDSEDADHAAAVSPGASDVFPPVPPGLPAPAPVPLTAAKAAQKTLLQEALDAARMKAANKSTERQPAVGPDPRRSKE